MSYSHKHGPVAKVGLAPTGYVGVAIHIRGIVPFEGWTPFRESVYFPGNGTGSLPMIRADPPCRAHILYRHGLFAQGVRTCTSRRRWQGLRQPLRGLAGAQLGRSRHVLVPCRGRRGSHLSALGVCSRASDLITGFAERWKGRNPGWTSIRQVTKGGSVGMILAFFNKPLRFRTGWPGQERLRGRVVGPPSSVPECMGPGLLRPVGI